MNIKKVLITSVIGAMMISSQAFAKDEITCPTGTASGSTCWKCGYNCTATLTGGKMTFSGTGDMYNYTAVNSGGVWQSNSPWNSHRNEILSVEIKDGITSVGEQSIRAFQNMTTLTMGNTVKKIGQGACYLCESLTSVTIPASVESIEYEAFSRAYDLSFVTYESNNNLKTLGKNAFAHTSLTSINIPDSVETIGDTAFWNCTSLTNIHLPTSLTSLGEKVFEYANLETLEFPEGITYIPDRTCAYCSNLKKIVVKGDNIGIYYNAFHGSDVNAVESSEAVKNILQNYFSSQLGRNVTWTEYFEPVVENHIIKRIYTVEEATEALGKNNKNTFSIRYR